MSETLIESVSDTAFWVAHYRGVETERPDALFQDPLAARLAGDHGRRIAKQMPTPFMTSWAVAIRTSIIDDFIRLAVADGFDTVLNLGAGLDTRPYRMSLPAPVTWIEADYPHVVAYKEKVLANETPLCKLRRLTCDLADATQRRQLLADCNAGSKKLLILTEGFVPYLSVEDAAALADDLRALDHAQGWIVDYFSPALMKYRRRRLGRHLRNAPFQFQPADWFGFFAHHGWRLKTMRYLAEEADRVGRPIEMPPLARIITVARMLFASKGRLETLRTYAGYVLLEPGPSAEPLPVAG